MRSIYKNSVIIALILCLTCGMKLFAQHQEHYSIEQFISGKDTLKYRMLLPSNFDTAKTYPVVLFLHGAGERGDDNQKQLAHGSELFYRTRDSFPAIVLFPQCRQDDYWASVSVDRSTKPLVLKFPPNSAPTKSMALATKLLDSIMSKPYANKNQVYVGGLSMGGMGTFEILYRHPETFAAAFAICGAGNPETTERYAKTVPMWIFHGAKDDVVNPQNSLDMTSGILKYGGTPNFTLYAKDNHNSWNSAFAEPQLLPWLFSNSKTNSK